MRMLGVKIILSLTCMCAAYVSPLAQPAQKPNAEKASAQYGNVDFNKYPTHITSDEFQVNNKSRKFQYKGSVKVLHNGMTLLSNKMDGEYSDKNQITKLYCYGDVYLDNGQGIKATGNKAVYDAKLNTVVLTESPEVTEKGSTIAADKITVFVKENRSEAIGRVRMRVAPKELSKEAKDQKKVESPVKSQKP